MRKVLYFLGLLEDTDILWLTYAGRKRTFRRGDILVQSGQIIDQIYIVIDGQLGVAVDNVGEIATLGAGEIIGEFSLIDSSPTTAVCYANTDTVVLAIERQELMLRLAENPAVAARVYRGIGTLMAQLMRSRVRRLGFGDDKLMGDDVEILNEFDQQTIDRMSLAGMRFDAMIKQIMTSIE